MGFACTYYPSSNYSLSTVFIRKYVSSDILFHMSILNVLNTTLKIERDTRKTDHRKNSDDGICSTRFDTAANTHVHASFATDLLLRANRVQCKTVAIFTLHMIVDDNKVYCTG